MKTDHSRAQIEIGSQRSWRLNDPLPPGGDHVPFRNDQVSTRRRSIVRMLMAAPVLPGLMAAWWTRPSVSVVVRDGWVLSRDD